MTQLSRPSPGVALLDFGEPPLNLLSRELRREVRGRLDALSSETVRVLVLRGRPTFSAGTDLKEALAARDTIDDDLRDFVEFIQAVESTRVVTIAAIDGHCFGGGLELALATDIRLATKDAVFSCSGVTLGLTMSSYRFVRAVGLARAKPLLLTGRRFGASEAVAMGLVSEVHVSDELEARALELGAHIASLPNEAVQATKQLSNSAYGQCAQDADSDVYSQLAVLSQTDELWRRVHLFVDGRRPRRSASD